MIPFNGSVLPRACLVSLLLPALAAAGQPPLEPLAFLAGQCWSATMPDGKSVDTHCFEWINAGHQLRDRHVVRGPGEEYRGETIYAWQPERGRIEYYYWDSSGGQSAGRVAVDDDGILQFLDDRYVSSDGSVQELESSLSRDDAGGYRIATIVSDGDQRRTLLDRTFRPDAQVAAVDRTRASGEGLATGVAQLQSAVGFWNVVTEVLGPDGTVTRSEPGTYRFDWVVPDRVLRGETVVPGLAQHAGILFYVNESKGLIEMASVGPDGRLWIMTGPIDGETRTTQVLPTRDGGTLQLRFTRFNVEADRFESRMEYTTDGGATWLPGNHQVFERAR